MAVDRTKQILDEVKALRKEMEERMDSLGSRLPSVAGIEPTGANDPDDDTKAAPEKGAPVSESTVVEEEAPAEVPINAAPEAAGGPEEAVSETEGAQDVVDASVGAEEVDVVLSPLLDISLARAIEKALDQSEEIKSAALREVRSDAAVISASIDSGVSVIAVLRSRLPISFSVIGSDAGSVTIALSQPADGDPDDSADTGNS